MPMTKTRDEQRRNLLKKAQEVIGIPMSKIDKTGRLKSGKGAIGTVIEESWFGYKPNSESEPDFPEAGLELKVTPYIRNGKKISAKERLVCNIINYMTEYRKTFETCDFWKKCNTMLIMSYEHKPNVDKREFTIDKAIIFGFPEEDLEIIKQDWAKIIAKIKNGNAHLISEADTLYLAACTKGENSKSVRQQPFSNVPAKQRAYSLKTTYMTIVLNNYIFGLSKDEHIIKDLKQLEDKSFEEIIIQKLRPFYGQTISHLSLKFGVKTNAKQIAPLLLSKMLGIEGNINNTAEFKSANITCKTVKTNSKGRPEEAMSFPKFVFKEIVNEKWETSEFKEMLETQKFLLAVFKEISKGEYVFKGVKFWNMPLNDVGKVKIVWEKTVELIKGSLEIWTNGVKTFNNFPKESENNIAHVRPHGRNSTDTDVLPDGRRLTKQCFWLNRDYIGNVISDVITGKAQPYEFDEYVTLAAAENEIEYDSNK